MIKTCGIYKIEDNQEPQSHRITTDQNIKNIMKEYEDEPRLQAINLLWAKWPLMDADARKTAVWVEKQNERLLEEERRQAKIQAELDAYDEQC